ncbi:hypothetical protein ACSQ67_007941 [Phaseolus vulgaris]
MYSGISRQTALRMIRSSVDPQRQLSGCLLTNQHSLYAQLLTDLSTKSERPTIQDAKNIKKNLRGSKRFQQMNSEKMINGIFQKNNNGDWERCENTRRWLVRNGDPAAMARVCGERDRT